MIERFSARVIAMIIFGAILLGLVVFGVTQCASRRTADKQAEVSKEQGQASIDAGAEASNTLGNVAGTDDATDAAVAAGQNTIRNTPEGLKGAATKREACKMKAYRDTPQCKEPER